MYGAVVLQMARSDAKGVFGDPIMTLWDFPERVG